MAVQLPRRFTQTWIERTLPGLSAADTDLVLAAMRAKGWSAQELESRVYPHVRRGGPYRNAAPAVAPAEQPRRRRWARKPTLTEFSGIAGIIGAAAAVVALFGPLGAAGGEPTPKAPSGPGRAPAENEESQAKLLLHVPPAIRPSCDANDDLRERFRAVAQFSCELKGTSQVAYYSFDSATALTAAYQPTSKRLPFGYCGKKWNVESGYHTKRSKTDVGLLSCYTVDGTAWIKWTRDDLLLYAYASRDDADKVKLFNAWNEAGPID